MRLFISKFVRKMNHEIMPVRCYYIEHMPESLNNECDCKVFCKFPPKGNSPIYLYPNVIMNKESEELILNKKLNNIVYGKEEQTEGKER